MEVIVTKAEVLTEKVAKSRVIKMTRFEKVTVGVIGMGLLLLMSATIYTRSVVSQTNAEIEHLAKQTQTTRVENQILQQKMDDLMTHERITSIASQYGMTRNESNVRTVTK